MIFVDVIPRSYRASFILLAAWFQNWCPFVLYSSSTCSDLSTRSWREIWPVLAPPLDNENSTIKMGKSVVIATTLIPQHTITIRIRVQRVTICVGTSICRLTARRDRYFGGSPWDNEAGYMISQSAQGIHSHNICASLGDKT